jgi:hypothetical protein
MRMNLDDKFWVTAVLAKGQSTPTSRNWGLVKRPEWVPARIGQGLIVNVPFSALHAHVTPCYTFHY